VFQCVTHFLPFLALIIIPGARLFGLIVTW
jgi:hypothetical protein